MCFVFFCRKEGYIPSNYVVEAENGLERFEWVCLLLYFYVSRLILSKVPCLYMNAEAINAAKQYLIKNIFSQLVLQEYEP